MPQMTVSVQGCSQDFLQEGAKPFGGPKVPPTKN